MKVKDKRGQNNGRKEYRRIELFLDPELSSLLDQLAYFYEYGSTIEYIQMMLTRHAIGEQVLIQGSLVQKGLELWRQMVPA